MFRPWCLRLVWPTKPPSRRLRGAAAAVLSLAVWSVVAVLYGLDVWHPVTTIPVQGAFIGLIIAGIAAAFEWLAGAAVTVAVTVAEAAIMIATAIAHFAIEVGVVFAKVYAFLGRFWDGALKPFVTWSWSQVERLHDWLLRVSKPLVDAIDWARAHVLAIYDHWLRPILTTIDVTRQTLALLAQLHVGWAKALDDKLGALEEKLLYPIRQAMLRLNEASNWINRIVTLDGLFQRLTFIASLWNYADDAWGALLDHRRGTTTVEQNAALRARAVQPLDAGALALQMADYYTAGAGELAPAIADSVATFNASLPPGQ